MAAKRKSTRRVFGSIRRLPSGMYQVRYRGPDGRVHTGPVTFESKSAADAYLATVQSDIVRRTWKAPVLSHETVGDYLAAWIAGNPRLKATTRALYEGLAARYVIPYPIATLSLAEVTPRHVRSWHGELSRDLADRAAQRTTRSRSTSRTGSTAAAQAYRLLRSAMSTAVRDGLILAQPCQVPGADRSPAAERPVATREQVAAAVEAMPERYRLLVLMATWTGLRFGELAALRRRDLDLDLATVRVERRSYAVRRGVLSGTAPGVDEDSPKSASGRRTVPLPGFLLPAIREHLATFGDPDDDALLFTTAYGNPVTTSAITPLWHRARQSAGRPDLRFHDLRHTGQVFAALAGATDAELRRRMGHATSAASAIYSHTADDHGRAVADRLSEMATTNVVPLRPRRTG